MFRTATPGYNCKNGLARCQLGLVDRIAGIVAFLRAGYPKGMPVRGYAPLLALLPRRVSDDEITTITSALRLPRRRPIAPADLNADVGVAITRITDEMPSTDDIERVKARLTENH